MDNDIEIREDNEKEVTTDETNKEVTTDETVEKEPIENKTGENGQAEKEKINVKEEILSWIKIFIVAIVIATVLDNFIIMNANVPTSSMENTIIAGDRMIGNRLAYIKDEPQRGDVIIFKFPDNEEEYFVKRIIGLPGEKVTISQGKIYINDSTQPLEEDYLPEEWTSLNDGLEYEVPAECYFVLGDNRNWSRDARYWQNTYVKRDAIIAKASFIYWPFKDAGMIESKDYSIDE